MFKASEEFEGAIDINHILNDASLHDELASLGWRDHTVKKKAVVKPSKPPKPSVAAPPQPTKQESVVMEPLDIGDVGLVDESSLMLTEQDMQDEGLLAEFDFINSEANGEQEDNDDGEEEHSEDDEEEEDYSNDPVIKPAANNAKAPASRPAADQTQSADNSGIPTAEEAKRNAIKYKREGNTTDALKWLRYAKQIETSAVNSPTLPPGAALNVPPAKPTNKPVPATPAAIKAQATANQATNSGNTSEYASYSASDPFGPLESAITEASKGALKEAKALEKSDPKGAVLKLREYKALQQEMAVLQSRRSIPGAMPALFHWATTRTETKIENMCIAEDEVKLTIEGLFGVSSLIEAHSSRSVGISYVLGINKDETAPVVTPQYKYENGNVKMNYSVTLPILKRGKHVQTLYARKKATFDIILYKGFWKGNETLCNAVLPLSDLLTKSTVGGAVALKSVTPEGSSGKKAKALGGSLNVTVSIRSPLGGPEIVYSEERRLVIEPWPAVVAPVHVPAVSVQNVLSTSSNAVSSNKAIADRDGATNSPTTQVTPTTDPTNTNTTESKPVLTGALATLTDKERTDPHSVDFIESNDVLEYEIATAQALMTTSTDEDEQFNSNMRVQLLNTKLQLLVYSVQNETLTMEQYLENIKTRLKRDQLIALYFKNLGEKENVDIALQVMKRVNIMKKEIQNVEEAQQEED